MDIYEKILALKKNGGEGVLITVVDKEGHGPAPVQTKMLYVSSREKEGTVGGGALEQAAEKAAKKVLKDKKGFLKKYLLDPDNRLIEGEETGMLCGGTTTLFFEYTGSGIPLYIFGAGHIGKALVYHLKHLSYYITMADSREETINEITGVQRRVTGQYSAILQGEEVREGSFFVIATHSHQLDHVVLKRIYEAGWKPAYIGVVASEKKIITMKEKLCEELGDEPDFSILYSPVGLDIGGTGPDEIALSIICELQALRYGKQGHKHLNPRL
ncbi:MAG: XdhC family protein [Candidatus Aminicenantes bacterium]|nr:XdhC family protein [Candidatus Aminicenantes bacterium]